MTPILRPIACALLLLALAAPVAHAQPAAAAAEAQQHAFSLVADEWRRALDAVQTALGGPEAQREALDELRAKVAAVRTAAAAARAGALAQRKPLADQLTALGPPPAKGQPPELPDVARQRQQLNDEIARYDSRVKQADLTIARAAALDLDNTRIGNEQLARLLLAREAPPFSRPVLEAAARQLADVLGLLGGAPVAWWSSSPFAQLELINLSWIALLALLALGVGWPLRNWFLRRYGHRLDIAEPSYARRVLAAGAEGLARGLLPAIGFVALIAVLLGEELVTGLFADMVEGVLVGITFFSLTSALARAALAPDAPGWRIVPFEAQASRTLARRLTALAAAVAVTLVIGVATHPLRADARELFNLLGLIFDTLIAGLTLALLQRRLWRIDSSAEAEAKADAEPEAEAAQRAERKRWLWPALRLLIAATLVAVPILALSGYANLAAHIVSRVVITGLVVGAFLLLRTMLREVVALLLASDGPAASRMRSALALSEQGGRLFAFWAETALDFLLILSGIALTLRLWGVPSSTLGLWAGGALRGVEVGNIRLSLGDILLAILVFAAFWTATRLFQRLLNEKLLPQTRLDPGVRHSLSAFVGYIGFIAAAGFAIATLGLSVSNLAIIAGALSVGIGFGLQNIVNNFVSGLILLIERPVKVGDWIVVGQHEGFVTRISVRATEIETFRRASVIIPNSELLSGAVTNWTHRDKYGRLDIKVGIAYGSETERVRELLLACAREHRQVLSWPEPHVLFTEFGDSALQFELRAFIGDVEQRAFVSSDLYFAIDKALREAGVEIPFPQRDVNLRNAEAVARALAQARTPVEPHEPAAGGGGAGGPPP